MADAECSPSSPARPPVLLGDLYPSDVLFVPRFPWRVSMWAPTDPAVQDLGTAASFTIAGSLPLLCARSATSERLLDATGDLFPPPAPAVRRYFDEEEFRREIERATEEGLRLVVNHLHPPDQLDPSRYLIPRELLIRLNDKARLAELAPPEFLAPRIAVPASRIVAEGEGRLPCAVKALSDLPVAGGIGVRFCRSRDDLVRAAEDLSSCDAILIEELLDSIGSDCVHFAVMRDSEVRYLGSTRQIIDTSGRHRGNTFGFAPENASAVERSRLVVERAAEAGYRGLAGIDVVIRPSGEAIVVDPNFRINASSPMMLLLHEQIRTGRRGMLAAWSCRGTFQLFVNAIRTSAADGLLAPLFAFDPDESSWPAPFMLRGVVFGDSKEDFDTALATMRSRGLDPQ